MYPYSRVIFELLFFFGFIGVVVMMVTGLGHHGGFGHTSGMHGSGSAGHAGLGHSANGALHGGAHSALGGHAAAGAHAPVGHAGGARVSSGSNSSLEQTSSTSTAVHAAVSDSGFSIVSLIPTPLGIFSFCLGAGLAGLLFLKIVTAPAIFAVALLGGAAFNFLIVRQIVALAFKFASKPSEGLEGLVASSAEAITRFDEHGMGMVRVVMEGQVVQLLATLDSAERASGVQVQKGDQVVLLEVDAKKNTCSVTREL